MAYSFQSIDKRNGKLVIDSKGCVNGYFFAAIAFPTAQRLKLRVKKSDDEVSTYDLKNDGTFEMFSFQFGDGKYTIILYENICGSKYAAIGTIQLSVKMTNKNAPFLVPNQYINYHQIPTLVSLTKQLCQSKSKNDSYKAIKAYIKQNYVYDYVKAASVKKGMLPDIKRAMQKKMGICFDLAALATAMLRIMGIPAKLIVGYADKQYHAWVEVIGSNKTEIYDPTADIYGINKVKKYITERYY